MSSSRKRDLVQAYKERKRDRGVFAVRCAPTGQVWVAATPNLESQKNSLWFSLRLGSARRPDMAQAWKDHGAEAFSYEVLEEIDDTELTSLGLSDLLKAREKHWREALGAASTIG
jgi:hypothetical protein